MFEDIIGNESCGICQSIYDYLDILDWPSRCPECDKVVKCSCGGYMNDWHSHASNCIVINKKKGKEY